VLDTVAHTPEENAHLILDYLIQRGFVRLQVVPGEEGAMATLVGKSSPAVTT